MRDLLKRLHRCETGQMMAEWVLVATAAMVLAGTASWYISVIVLYQFYRTATIISMPIL